MTRWCERHDREVGSPRWPCPPVVEGGSEVIYDCGCHWVWYPTVRDNGLTSYQKVHYDPEVM